MAEPDSNGNISQGVGRQQRNLPKDVVTIKHLLNEIPSELGGAAGSLDEKDSSASGADFHLLQAQIFMFQSLSLAGQVVPDEVVRPNQLTHQALKRLGLKRMGVLDIGPRDFVPIAPLFSDVDAFGFSRARLSRVKPGDWTQRDDSHTAVQMVPVGGQRTLRLATGPTLPGLPEPFIFSVEPAGKVRIASSNAQVITVEGLTPGMAVLVARNLNFDIVASILLNVRPLVTVTLNVFNVGAPGVTLWDQYVDAVVGGLARIYRPQANVTFTKGKTGVITSVDRQQFKKGKPIYVAHDRFRNMGFPHLSADAQIVTMSALEDAAATSRNDSTMSIFLSDEFRSVDDRPGHTAEGQSNTTSACWFNSRTGVSGSNFFTGYAHEIGHCLGLTHITAKEKNGKTPEHYLMRESLEPNNLAIPAETLVDLRLPPQAATVKMVRELRR